IQCLCSLMVSRTCKARAPAGLGWYSRRSDIGRIGLLDFLRTALGLRREPSYTWTRRGAHNGPIARSRAEAVVRRSLVPADLRPGGRAGALGRLSVGLPAAADPRAGPRARHPPQHGGPGLRGPARGRLRRVHRRARDLHRAPARAARAVGAAGGGAAAVELAVLPRPPLRRRGPP